MKISLGLCLLMCLAIRVENAVIKWPETPTLENENLAHASLQFGWDSYRALKVNPGDNVFFSPYSITNALSMLVLGSKGTTEADLLTVLRVPEEMTTRQMHEELNAENAKLAAETNATFGVANRYFVDDGVVSKVNPKYSTDLKNFYNASLEPTPFATNPTESRNKINGYVSHETRGEIPELLANEPSVRTKLSLVNAIYFKGTWTTQFNINQTVKEPFHAKSGDVEADMMKLQREQWLTYGECENGDCQLVALPYTTEAKYAMIAVIPKEGLELEALEAKLDHQKLRSILKQAKQEKVNLDMPRISMKNSFKLRKMLTDLGATNIFGATGAENSKIFTEKVEDTLVDDVIHEAKVKVNEEGTIAAAATATSVTRLSSIPEQKPKIVKLDRPYIFFITDVSNGFVLFWGRVGDPTKST